MAKVLRLHNQANDNITDWGKCAKYGSNVINQIEDPAGATAKKEITSIPSPFARIDLAKTAFKIVADSKDLDGNTIHHKLVSDCLDIGEILFNYDKLADKLDIIVWDRETELKRLKESREEEHRILGQTLDMYLNQDAKAYNFDKLDKIFLLNYKGKGRPDPTMNIIGATSPCTLFFSSANDLSYASEYLRSSGKDKPFDNDYSPLYKRDFQFQKYIYSLREAYGQTQFAKDFPEFDRYIEESSRWLTDEQKDEIDKLDNQSINAFQPLEISGNTVSVCGMKFRKSVGTTDSIIRSDFAIKSAIAHDKMPLVIPVETGNSYTDLTYIQDKWQDTNHAPYEDRKAISERTLPYSADKYPYLTISDFLQPTVLSMPYPLSKEYFNGNISGNLNDSCFLLPLTETFFEYFTVEDLQTQMPDGKDMIEMKALAGGSVSVTLRIPIQKGRYVQYYREYYNSNKPDIEQNKGAVKEKSFGLGVFPLVKFNEGTDPYYRIAFLSKQRGSSLSFALSNVNVESIKTTRRQPGDNCGVESYVVENRFSHIYVSADGVKNVIVPQFKQLSNSKVYTFAVDFGTTNTHVEYSVDGSSTSYPLDIKNTEVQMVRMHSRYSDLDINGAFADAFVPETIADGDEYSFPMRTAFAEYVNIDYNKNTNSLADGNIPFRYEKVETPNYHEIKTDIKWSNRESDRVKLYLDNLFLIMRNKVLISGGRLSETKVVWFYPVSMTRARRNEFANVWQSLYKKYFGEDVDNNLLTMSESVAPYDYYKRKKGAKSNVVTVDIGGGTTDIYVVEDSKPKFLSSFRFAANSIFGDGYNFPSENNGFVVKYKDKIMSILESNSGQKGINDLISAYEDIEHRENSNDIIAYFFSLASHKAIVEKKIPLDFQDMLAKDEKLKYVFIVFYGAIIYYVAKMMKNDGLSLPQTIAFSGNGSKTLKVLSTDKETVAKFASLIFEKVFGQKYTETSLEVLFDSEPKLATCKGGIVNKDKQTFDQIQELKKSLLGVDGSTMSEGLTYTKIDENTKKDVANQVSEYIDFIFSINSENKNFFINDLAADSGSLEKARKICKTDLIEYTKQGFDNKMEELKSWGLDADAEIEETLFFYPLVAILSKLAREI